MRRTIMSAVGSGLFAALLVLTSTLSGQTYAPLGPAKQIGVLPAAAGSLSGNLLVAAPSQGYSFFDPATRSIVHHDANGRVLRRFALVTRAGSKGRLVVVHGWYGDVLWVHDARAESLTLFEGATGRLTATFDVSRGNKTDVQALSPGGAPILLGRFPATLVAGRPRQYGFAVSPGLGLSPGKAAVVLPPDGCQEMRGITPHMIPWCQRSLGAVSPSGEWVVVVVPAVATTGRRDAVTATFLSVRGDTLAVVRVEAPTQVFAAQGAPASEAARHIPVVTSLIATRDGTVWLAQESATINRYIVVSSAGAVVARYSTPPRLRLAAVAGRTAFGLQSRAGGDADVMRIRF